MRILHTSDWHLGRTFHGRVLDNAHTTFASHLVELVTIESVDTVLVAEDVYDRAVPPNDAIAFLDETLRRLTERAQVILTPGNHNFTRRLGFAANLIREDLIIRTRITDFGRGIILPDADGNEATIVHTLPYLDPDAAREILPPLLTERLGEEIPTKHTAGEDQAEGEGVASQPVQPEHPRLPRSHEAVVSAALRLVAADLDRPRTGRTRRLSSLLMAHAFVVGGEACESERDIRVGSVDSVPSGVFTTLDDSPLAECNDDLNYVALGHLHRLQELTRSTGPRLVYSGSPLPLSFDEAEDARNAATKFSVLLDLGANSAAGLEHIPTPVLHQVRILAGTIPELFPPTFDDAVGAWVRIVLQSERPPGTLATLEERLPSLLAFQHGTPTCTVHGCITVTATANPLRVTEDSSDDVYGRAPQPSERSVLRSTCESALANARSER